VTAWADRRLLELFGVEHPILLAPMAGAMDATLCVEVCEAGGLGSLPCALLDTGKVRAEVARIRASTARPFNLNFFCHEPPQPDEVRMERWRARLTPYYAELHLDPRASSPSSQRAPFDESWCALVEELQPAVVSFHFGLPERALLERVRAASCKVIASATTVTEARFLEERGVDAIIAQGAEAGGHRGMFLSRDVATQVGTFALVPLMVDAVRVPVIAAGAVADSRGFAAALALGAAGVQVGTAYLRCPESRITAPHRDALRHAPDDGTALTNVMTGRPARGFVNRVMRELGPMSDDAPQFPLAAGPLAPLRAAAEANASGDFSPMWSGQAASLGGELPARELTTKLARETLELLRRLATGS
jgi:nitronate monooxygenase